jgi:hypothetical protein
MSARRTLAVSHAASRDGAPLSLLTYLRWLAQQGGTVPDVLLLEDGPLRTEFEAVAPKVGVGTSAPEIDPASYEVVLLNSAFAAPVLQTPLPGRVVARIPELGVALTGILPPDQLAALLARADAFVAVSGAVRDHLVDEHGVAPERITVVGGALDRPRVPGTDEVAAARAAMGLAPDRPVVAACGVLEWRKGHDLFVQLGVALRSRGVLPTLLWIGDARTDTERTRWDEDVEAAGLGGQVVCSGMLADALPAIGAADLFVLTSREDPFPRVALEAGLMARPIVAFASGGVTELVGTDAGVVVAPIDVEAMADAVAALLADRPRAAALGVAARHRVESTGTVQTLGPQLLAVLEA